MKTWRKLMVILGASWAGALLYGWRFTTEEPSTQNAVGSLWSILNLVYLANIILWERHPEWFCWHVWHEGKRIDKKEVLQETLFAVKTRHIWGTKQRCLKCGKEYDDVRRDMGWWSFKCNPVREPLAESDQCHTGPHHLKHKFIQMPSPHNSREEYITIKETPYGEKVGKRYTLQYACVFCGRRQDRERFFDRTFWVEKKAGRQEART